MSETDKIFANKMSKRSATVLIKSKFLTDFVVCFGNECCERLLLILSGNVDNSPFIFISIHFIRISFFHSRNLRLLFCSLHLLLFKISLSIKRRNAFPSTAIYISIFMISYAFFVFSVSCATTTTLLP